MPDPQTQKPIHVTVPGLGPLTFPAGTSEADMQAAIEQELDRRWGGSDKNEPEPSFLSRAGESASDFLKAGATLGAAFHGDSEAMKHLGQGAWQTAKQTAQDVLTTNPAKFHPIKAVLRLAGVNPESAAEDFTKGNWGALAGDVAIPGAMAMLPKVPKAGVVAEDVARGGARAVGGGLRAAGAAPFLGASTVATGLRFGSPKVVAGGMAIMISKPILKGIGERLHAWGSVPTVNTFANEFMPSLEGVSPAMAKQEIAAQALRAKSPEIQQFLRELDNGVDKVVQAEKDASASSSGAESIQAAAEKRFAQQIEEWRKDTHQLQRTTAFERQQAIDAERAHGQAIAERVAAEKAHATANTIRSREAVQQARAQEQALKERVDAARAQQTANDMSAKERVAGDKLAREQLAAEEIAAAKAGREAQPPTIRETISAPTITGRESMTRRFEMPEEAAATGPEPIDIDPRTGYPTDPARLQEWLEQKRLSIPQPTLPQPVLRLAQPEATTPIRKTPISEVIPSKSKSARGTGLPLSPNDLEAAGITLPPGARPTGINTDLLTNRVYPSRTARGLTIYQEKAVEALRTRMAEAGASPEEIEDAISMLPVKSPLPD